MIKLIGGLVLVLVFLLSTGMPLPVCFVGGLFYMSVFSDVSMRSLTLWGLQQILNPVMLAVPLFIFAGTLLGGAGIAKRILDFTDLFIGHIKGGLCVIAATACAILGAITGSGFTGAAAMGPMLIPRMVEQGYPRGFATAVITVSSILGLMIPPSVVMIIYGWVTETSILACFLATVGPGILILLGISIVSLIYSKKLTLSIDTKEVVKEKRKELPSRTLRAFPALLMPFIVLGGIYGGIFTTSEAAAVSAVYAIFVAFIVYRDTELNVLFKITKESAISVGAIMMMIMFCLMLAQTLVMTNVPQQIVKVVFTYTQNKYLLLFLVNVLLIFLGMVVNDTSAIILCAPLLLPLMKEIGVHPVHLAAIMGTNLGIGGLTPPYASLLYLGMRIGKCEFNEIAKPVLIFILVVFLPVILLTTYWPALSLFLPRLLGYI